MRDAVRRRVKPASEIYGWEALVDRVAEAIVKTGQPVFARAEGQPRGKDSQMKAERQLIVFANGDARDASTWSNVPYMFLRTLESVRPDVEVTATSIRLYDSSRFVALLAKLWNKFLTPRLGSLSTFDRTGFYRALVLRKMRSVENSVAGRGALLTFDLSNPAPHKAGFTTCLLGDWTIGYEIVEHLRRAPTKFERKLIERQNASIDGTDHVAVLFPRSAHLVSETCPTSDVRYFGLPANIDSEIEPNYDRSQSQRILFIGKPAYRKSLETIVAGLRSYNESNSEVALALDVIGMESGQGSEEGRVAYHGYLRKDVPEERKLYYGLLTSCKAMITVSDRWVGASSIIEAMFLGTPVVVTPNPELEEMLGEPDWGFWCGASSGEVTAALGRLCTLDEAELKSMSRNAHGRVAEYTWNHFVRSWCDAVGL